MLQSIGLIDDRGTVASTVIPEKIEEIELPPEAADVKEIVTAAIEKAEPIKTETITGTTYTATITEEKTFTYEQATHHQR